MNTNGEVADLLVKEGIQITESTAKLVGLGAKNLAAIIIALINEDTKLQGKTNLKQLLKSDKPLGILQIRESDLKNFNTEAKKYGVLFTAVSDKNNNTGFCDIIAKQDDVTKLNYIMEKMGYAAPDIPIEPEKDNPEKPDTAEKPDKPTEEQEKNRQSRAEKNPQKENPHGSKSTTFGDTEKTDNGINGKPSVKKKIEDIKAEQRQQNKKRVPEKQQTQQNTQQKAFKKKKKNSKQKGR